MLGLLAVAFAYGFSAYAQKVASAKLGRNFVFKLRQSLVEKMTSLSLDVHQRYGAGELMDRVLGDTDILRRFIDRVFIQAMTNVLRVGYPIAMLIVIDRGLAMTALSVLLPQWWISRQLQRRLHSATVQTRATNSDLTTVLKESLDGIETIKTLNAMSNSNVGICDSAKQLETDELRVNRLSALVSGNVWLMTSIGVALTWWQGGMLVLDGTMTLGTLVIFTGFVVFAYRPFRQFTTIATTYRRGLVSLQRIQELLDQPSSVPERDDARPLRVSEARIRFDNVSFGYSEHAVLEDVDLEILPRQFTAVVGRSGSGKSSLLRLIVRLYDPDIGRVSIDGQYLDDISMDSLRSSIAVVPQRPVLFSGTVRENICLARPGATDEEVRGACEAAGAWEFIEQLSHGLETRVGRGGRSLSGGQLQRVAIARALLCQPRILLMDEPTAALDSESEAAIVRTLRRLRKEMTVVLIGHRRKTVCSADRIIVMDEGRVVGDGTHEELLLCSNDYADLFATEPRDIATTY